MAANNSLETLSSHLKDLMENQADFPQDFKQWLLVEADELDNPGRLQFISELYSSGLLGNDSMGSEMNCILKMTVEVAVAIIRAKSDNVEGCVKWMVEMDLALGKLDKDESGCGSQDDLAGQLTSVWKDRVEYYQADFPQVFKRFLLELDELANLDNPARLQLISALYSSGLLGNDSMGSKVLNCMVKNIVQAAVGCAKIDNVQGLVKALDNMDNTGMISRLLKLVQETLPEPTKTSPAVREDKDASNKDSVPADSIVCPCCTFHNPKTRVVCEMCEQRLKKNNFY